MLNTPLAITDIDMHGPCLDVISLFKTYNMSCLLKDCDSYKHI